MHDDLHRGDSTKFFTTITALVEIKLSLHGHVLIRPPPTPHLYPQGARLCTAIYQEAYEEKKLLHRNLLVTIWLHWLFRNGAASNQCPHILTLNAETNLLNILKSESPLNWPKIIGDCGRGRAGSLFSGFSIPWKELLQNVGDGPFSESRLNFELQIRPPLKFFSSFPMFEF